MKASRLISSLFLSMLGNLAILMGVAARSFAAAPNWPPNFPPGVPLGVPPQPPGLPSGVPLNMPFQLTPTVSIPEPLSLLLLGLGLLVLAAWGRTHSRRTSNRH